MMIDQTHFRDFLLSFSMCLCFLIVYFLIDQIRTKLRERLLKVFDQNLLTTFGKVNN